MLFGFLICVIIIFIFYHHWSIGHWKRKNIFSLKGDIFFGNIKDILLGKETLVDMIFNIYENHKSQGLIGLYGFYHPVLIPTEPELIKEVLIKNFKSFADIGYRIHRRNDPMFGINPFCTIGLQEWKKVRGIHAPFHSLGKLKEMTQNIIKTGENMMHYIKEKGKSPIDILDLTGRFTVDNVVSCGYGIEQTSFSDSENMFRKHATHHLFNNSFWPHFSAIFAPKLGLLVPLRVVTKHAECFFISMVRKIKEKRNSDLQRSDLIGLLMKYKKNSTENNEGLTDEEIAGHCVTFYLDGYETTSSALSFALLELANHSEIQEKLRQEILLAGKDINCFTLEKIHSLSYLTMVVNEVMRLHPLLPVTYRECTESTSLGGKYINKGTKVLIPVKCLHYDPDLFPEPHTFKPQRFEDDANIVKCSFLPFGEGPRMCLGVRFATLQIKLGIILILLNFKVLPVSGKEKVEISEDPGAPFVVLPMKDSKLIFQPL